VTTHVERSIEVAVPVRAAYDQWTRFEEFPRFMSGVEEVRQVGDAMTHWVAQIAGVRREWDAAIVEQVPDEKVAWAATTGATNAGTVFFDRVGTDRTRVRLTLDFEPEGLVERLGDVLDVVDRQAVADLDRFKEFIEGQRSASGGWRGTIEDGDVVSEGTGQQTNAGLAGATAGATSGRETADDVPGDVVAVGPTGGTESTLHTEAGEGRSTAPAGDDTVLGHSGDPVAVDPAAVGGTGHGNAGDAERTGTAAGAGSSSDAGVAGFGTDTGLSSSSTSGVLTGDPGSASRTGSDDAERTGTAAGAAASAGVAGFGTDTGLSSGPTSGVLTGDPGGRAASHAGTGTGGRHEAWTDEPGARGSVTGAATDPVGEDRAGGTTRAWADDAGSRSATTGTDEPWAAGGSGPGEDRGVPDTAGEGIVRRNYADEDITTRDVVARDFSDRDVSGEGTVERDFANRDITERDIANRGIVRDEGDAHLRPSPQPHGLDALDAPGPADGIGAGLDPLDPRAGTADDPDNPIQPSV